MVPFLSPTLFGKMWFYFVITRICPNMNTSKVTKKKVLYIYAISGGIPFDIGQVITKYILERTKRLSNTMLKFPSLITELCMLSQVPILWNKEKTSHPNSLSIKGIKTQPRKSVRGETSRSMAGYDSRRDDSNEKREAGEDDEDVATDEEEEETIEMPSLRHQGKLILQSFSDMFNNHN